MRENKVLWALALESVAREAINHNLSLILCAKFLNARRLRKAIPIVIKVLRAFISDHFPSWKHGFPAFLQTDHCGCLQTISLPVYDDRRWRLIARPLNSDDMCDTLIKALNTLVDLSIFPAL